MSIRIEVKGKRALFTRPEFSTERVSYDVITPSAAKGIIGAVFWHAEPHKDRIYAPE